MSAATGKVWIVGAGPGAPDLLTLRAARAIEQAEVLIWTDSLVNPQLAAMAPESCERIRTSTLTLEEVMGLMLDRVKDGKRVVRLHDGDTCLYSALNEQLCRLLDAEVDVEVVPGPGDDFHVHLGIQQAAQLLVEGAVEAGVAVVQADHPFAVLDPIQHQSHHLFQGEGAGANAFAALRRHGGQLRVDQGIGPDQDLGLLNRSCCPQGQQIRCTRAGTHDPNFARRGAHGVTPLGSGRARLRP